MRPPCPSLVLALLLLVAGCAEPPKRVGVQQDMAMGPFILRAEEVRAYSRAHQGVPWQVEVAFTLSGGNRFDRSDFAERVSRGGKLRFQTSDGWRDRAWLLRRGDEAQVFYIQTTPPLGSHGYTLEIGNPYGHPSAYLLDLGQ
jgi:hypothetical protein